MMGLDTPETCRGWRSILRISCPSSWFFFTRVMCVIDKSERQRHFVYDVIISHWICFKYLRFLLCLWQNVLNLQRNLHSIAVCRRYIYMDTYSNVTQCSFLGILTPRVFHMQDFAFQNTLWFNVLMGFICISKLIIKHLYAIIVKGNYTSLHGTEDKLHTRNKSHNNRVGNLRSKKCNKVRNEKK